MKNCKVWLLRTDFDSETTMVTGDGQSVLNEVMSWSDYAIEECSYDSVHFFAKGYDRIIKALDESEVNAEVEFPAELVDVSSSFAFLMAAMIKEMPQDQRGNLAEYLCFEDSHAAAALYRYIAADEPIVEGDYE